jgi:hypothetical protein
MDSDRDGPAPTRPRAYSRPDPCIESREGPGELLELNYLQKPLHPEQLAKELARYCDPAGGPYRVLGVDANPGTPELHSRLVK